MIFMILIENVKLRLSLFWEYHNYLIFLQINLKIRLNRYIVQINNIKFPNYKARWIFIINLRTILLFYNIVKIFFYFLAYDMHIQSHYKFYLFEISNLNYQVIFRVCLRDLGIVQIQIVFDVPKLNYNNYIEKVDLIKQLFKMIELLI